MWRKQGCTVFFPDTIVDSDRATKIGMKIRLEQELKPFKTDYNNRHNRSSWKGVISHSTINTMLPLMNIFKGFSIQKLTFCLKTNTIWIVTSDRQTNKERGRSWTYEDEYKIQTLLRRFLHQTHVIYINCS